MRLAGLVCLLAALALGGCASAVTNTTVPVATGEPAVPSGDGMILSMRPVTVHGDQAPWGVALLATASGPTRSGNDAGARLTEFIVRTRDGSIISVVQTAVPGFHPGDRVIVLHDGQTHIARPG